MSTKLIADGVCRMACKQILNGLIELREVIIC
jgi:hypothetical protein